MGSYAGSCLCRTVTFIAHAEPGRVGLCHCMDCRKRHAAAFHAFVNFSAQHITFSGPTEPTPGGARFACARCHAPMYWTDGKEVEVSLGSFDRVGLFMPQYEIWTVRREPWLAPLDVPQYEHNRFPPGVTPG